MFLVARLDRAISEYGRSTFSIAVDAVFRPAMKRNFFGQAKQQAYLYCATRFFRVIFKPPLEAATRLRQSHNHLLHHAPRHDIQSSCEIAFWIHNKSLQPDRRNAAVQLLNLGSRRGRDLNLGSNPDVPSIASPRASCQAYNDILRCVGRQLPPRLSRRRPAIGPAAHAADRTAAGARTHNTTG